MTPELDLTHYALDAARVSVLVALLSTALIAPPGVLLGYVLARRRFVGRTLVQTLVAMPLVLPPVAVGVALLTLLGRRGPIGGALHETFGVDLVFTWWGAALAAAVMSFPLLVRASEAAFAEVPVRLEQVARTLGASRSSAFIRVSLPLARRGILYGLLLAFARGLGEFGATILVAGNIPGETTTLAVGIFSRYENGDTSAAMTLIAISSAFAFLSILAAEWALRRPRP